MSLFRFGRQLKPQQFNYIPRFYDPEKEERDARVKAAMGQSDYSADAVKVRISKNFREKPRGKRKLQQSAAMRSNIILVMVLVCLLLLTYILLTRYMPMIERWLE
jgi:hypothetical protein